MAIVFSGMFKKTNELKEPKSRGALRWLHKSKSTKCHPVRAEPSSCCKTRLAAEAPPQYDVGAPEVTISHRFIDRPRVRINKLVTVVGGHKVPFSEHEIFFWKSEYEHKNTLSPIAEEDKTMCESCQAVAFTKNARNVCITLTKVSRRRRAL
ncbi:hypothetical protein ACHHYP_01496 [Achlya hypogyna]|uniref:Uncharacterized protein n=1 Tax=Achlya hypogyna TaxID=1202772 RepID=A0A1V9ZTY4_ACHHY|nr:hypothetical protein ACHHYP_01496 [Achlya hypogyna]